MPGAEVTRPLGERALVFGRAALMTPEGLLMTPRRTETDGFFVSVLMRRDQAAAAAAEAQERQRDHRYGVVSKSVSGLDRLPRQAAHNRLKCRKSGLIAAPVSGAGPALAERRNRCTTRFSSSISARR